MDLTDSFAGWLDGEKYREHYFKNPKMMAPKLPRFLDFAADKVVAAAEAQGADEDTVVAVLGVASLFGFVHVSDLVPRVVSRLSGRLLVFFPGSREANVYKLLDAREGWNYLATPITPSTTGALHHDRDTKHGLAQIAPEPRGFATDPDSLELLNHGVAEVKGGRTEAELRRFATSCPPSSARGNTSLACGKCWIPTWRTSARPSSRASGSAASSEAASRTS